MFPLIQLDRMILSNTFQVELAHTISRSVSILKNAEKYLPTKKISPSVTSLRRLHGEEVGFPGFRRRVHSEGLIGIVVRLASLGATSKEIFNLLAREFVLRIAVIHVIVCQLVPKSQHDENGQLHN